MKQKQVKINGLKVNHQFGILEVCDLVFDEKLNMYVTKGKSGHGKTHVTTAIQLATQGSKALVDNQKYGKIDLEVQLTDGDYKLWVSCKSGKKSLQYSLFAKDENGKKIKKLIIDGVEAKPTEYLKALQTELTWKMDELTSENPSVQKKILLQLYQSQLKQIGVIFDKNHPDYESSIRGRIDKAISNRDEKDFLRKQNGGIADDLKAQGFDPDRPDTCPDSVNIAEIESKIKEVEAERTTLLAAPEEKKKAKLSDIKARDAIITGKCVSYNSELKDEYESKLKSYNTYMSDLGNINEQIEIIRKALEILNMEEYIGQISNDIDWPKQVMRPEPPIYIQFEKNGQVAISPDLNDEGQVLLKELSGLRVQYANTDEQEASIDVTHLSDKIEKLEKRKVSGIEINKIVAAIDSFHQWRAANEDVVQLKHEYVGLLAQIETGVKGLQIIPVEDDIFLMYDGSYDVNYFQPRDKKPVMRKVSSYSGTQKPAICLLIQNYLLSKKPKAMRYLHIDNVPIDNTSKALLEKMSKELDLHIFLNITGDFESDKLQDGEILIEGGEIFFNN